MTSSHLLHPVPEPPRIPIAALIPLLVVGTWPIFGGFVVSAAVIGVCMGAGLHRWYCRHPLTVPGGAGLGRPPEINVSAIQIAGDTGGLIFVAGSVVTLLLSLPDMRVFLAASMLCSLAVAAVLARHRAQTRGLFETALGLSRA